LHGAAVVTAQLAMRVAAAAAAAAITVSPQRCQPPWPPDDSRGVRGQQTQQQALEQ